MGLAPKMSPNRPRGQILRRFPEPSAKRPPWPKSRVLFGLGIWGGCAGIPALIRFIWGVLEAPQHGTHCPQAPWPEEQRWLKRKRLSAHPKKSCRLDCVVPPMKVPNRNFILIAVVNLRWFLNACASRLRRDAHACAAAAPLESRPARMEVDISG